MLFISAVLSITFYAFGLVESILLFWPVELWGAIPGYAIPLLTAVVIILITFAAGKSAELVLKFQIPMLIRVVLSILALIIGTFMNDLQAPEWTPAYRTLPDGGFWIIFAVFFPGVTGFLAGISMSGDLKTPGKSIRNGTLNSVITGMLVYLLIPVLLSITVLLPFDEMTKESFDLRSWTEVAFLGGLFIYPAACGAILSSAIGSVLSSPRVLQSLSMDGLAPKFLSHLSKTGQPTIATWITGGIALAAVTLGLEFACYAYFKKKALEQQWGDVNAGLWMKVTRFSLLRMNERQISARNWRPIMLLFAENITRRIELVKLAAAFG